MAVTYGSRNIIASTPTLGADPMGVVTMIPEADISVDKLDLFVTGWIEPDHRLESKIGTEKIEDGSPITDHVVAMPAQLRLVGIVSDITMGSDAPGTAWEEIRRLHSEEAILTLITEYGMYKEMVIKSVNTTQTSRGMEFTLQLQNIVRVGVGQSALIESDSNNPASSRTENVDAGDKDLIDVPVTPLGGNRFRVGTANDPASQIIEYRLDAQGAPITDDTGNIRYFTVDPAPDSGE